MHFPSAQAEAAPTQSKGDSKRKGLVAVALALSICALMFMEPAFATGAGTGTGAGGASVAQARIVAIATGWQNIVQGIGVIVLIIAWSFIGYQIAFSGKTMKDMVNPMVGSTIAGLAPVLVGWLFS